MSTARRHVDEAALPAKDVVLVVFDGAEAIDVAGPASVFSKAEQMCPGTYRLHVAAPRGGNVQTNSGLCIHATEALGTLPERIDTLVIAGGDEAPLRALLQDRSVFDWLARVAPAARRLTSVCSGAFALAAAGLLDGREATTHWSALDLLQAVRPAVRVRRDRIYVRDGHVWTSGGVTTAIELALALVEDDLGREVAMAIARTLALPMLRGARQPQVSQALQVQSQAGDRLRELVSWIRTHLREDLSVDALAQRAHMSPRNFARAFAAETGCTPGRFVERVRVEAAAELLLESRWTQDRIAQMSGFGSVDALQRAFLRLRGQTPGTYRTLNRGRA